MLEEILITARHNPKVDPMLGIWTWEISVYLFLGGLTAGIIIFVALMNLLEKNDSHSFSANRLALWAPIVLSVGMTTLFLDLEHKLYVFRFYTTLEPTSPMSWGAWVLMIIYPISILQILSTFRPGYPLLAGWFEKIPGASMLLNLCERYIRVISWIAIPSAVALGIYTGVLLSAFNARPFWNTGLLGPLFLVSVLIMLWMINLATGSEQQLRALEYLTQGGGYAVAFWGAFFIMGLVVPLFVEFIDLVHKNRTLVILGPVLVLLGGYMLRHITVNLGQETTWQEYGTQFSVEALERVNKYYGNGLN
jgi:formate-dependent nitrite reductase membrane component NrfD